MHVKTEFAYSYQPVDFFDGAATITLPNGVLSIENGEGVFTLAESRRVDHEHAQSATADIRAVFQVRQALTRRVFVLTGPRVTHHRDDGLRDYVLLVETGRFELRGYPIDLRITDAAGNVVRDTKADRLAHDTAFLQAIAAKIPSSPVLRRMFESYGRSAEDPANELVHLYEIRDAASSHYGTEAAARHALGISKNDWSQMGRLANDGPLREGRHRGRQSGRLRNARQAELDSVRLIARRIIVAFTYAG
jgi:hypothetical protein